MSFLFPICDPSDTVHSFTKARKASVSPPITHILSVMASCLLLILLLVSTVSSRIRCLDSRGQTVPSVASCNVALRHLARYLLPCLGKETVTVSSGFRGPAGVDIRLPSIFADTNDYPQTTVRCRIEFWWQGPDHERESIQPGKLQTFATEMENQCIAASPPQVAAGEIEPNRWIFVSFKTDALNGNSTIPGVNGTLTSGFNGTMTPANPFIPNPTDACRSAAEPLYEVDLDFQQPSVESS